MGEQKGNLSPEEIEARKERSRQKYLRIKQEHTKQRAARKATKAVAHAKRVEQQAQARAGKEWLASCEEEIHFGHHKIDQFQITFGIMVKHSEYADAAIVHFAYAIKSPTDKDNQEFAKGLVAHRLYEGTQGWFRTLRIPSDVAKFKIPLVKTLVTSIIYSRVIMRGPEIPQRMINSLFGESIKALRKEREDKRKAEKANKAA
jgi:hypothetical protein